MKVDENYLKKELYELIKADEGIFDFIQKSSLDGLWYWDLEHPENEWMNPKFWTELGYDPAEMPHKSAAWQNIINQEDLKVAIDNFQKHCENPDHPYDQIVRYNHKNGSTVWIRCRGMAIRNKEGIPVRMLGAHHNITDAKNAELDFSRSKKDVEENERKFSSYFNTNPAATFIWLFDKDDFYLIDVNETANRITDNHAKNFIGLSAKEIYADLQIIRDKLFECYSTKSIVEFECHYLVRYSNEFEWMKFKFAYLEPNKVVLYTETYTKQKNAETELILAKEKAEKSEEKYRLLIDNLNDLVCEIDENGIYTFVNAQYKHILGYEPSELIGCAATDLIHPDDLTASIEKYSRIQENLSASTDIWRFKHKNGEFHFIESKGNVYLNSKGEKRTVVISRDINERFLLEKELINSKERAEKSEEKYKSLFSNMMNAFSLLEMIFDESGEPIDYTLLEVNPIWEKIVGIKAEAVIGKRIKEIMPDIEKGWIDAYGKVAQTGIPMEYVDFNAATKKYYNVFAYRHEKNIVAALFSDVTDKMQAEIEIRRAKERAEESEAFLNATGEIASIGGWKIDLTNNQLFWTDQVYRMHEVERDFQLTVEKAISFYDEASRGIIEQAVEDAILKGKPFDVDLGLNTAKGTHILVRAIGKAYHNKNGAIDFVSGTIQDITKRKKAEEDLRNSEERFLLAMKASNDGLFDWNLETNAIYYSVGWKKMLGYEDHELPNDFEVWEKTTDAEDVKKSWELQQKLISKQIDRFVLEYKMKHKDGHWVDILSRAEAYFNEQGKAIRIVGTHTDITERKRAEKELVRAKREIELSEEKFRNLAENSTSLIYRILLKPHLHFDYVSPSAEIITGYTPEEHYNDPLLGFKLIHPDDLRKLRNTAQIPTGETVELRWIRKDGAIIWTEQRNILTFDENNEPLAIEGSARDITEMKLAEIQLKEAKEKAEESEKNTIALLQNYNLAQSIANVGTWEWNMQTNEVLWSEGIYGIFEVEKGVFIPGFENNASFIAPEELDDYYNLFQHCINTGDLLIHDFRIITGKGNSKFLNTQGKVFYDENKQPLKFIGTVLDVTTRKNIENELKNAKEKAEESNRLKTAFVQNLSHEIRTPMNAIMGFAELLPENFGNLETLEEYSKIIFQRGNDLLDIINDILDISKIESGQNPVKISECNLNQLFADLGLFFSDYQKRIRKSQVEMVFEPPVDDFIGMIRTDAVKLRQILVNLISNALKFTENGSVRCDYRFQDNKIMFHVTDTGIGIPRDKFDYIFERFTQLKHPLAFNASGTGLGLSIVKALAELLGGEVWLESEYTKGTTFYFAIDYCPAPEVSGDSIKPEIMPNKNRIDKKILIVEDDEYNSKYLQEALKMYYTNIYFVSTGNEAIQFLKEQSVDIVLMDVRLPDISGYDATRAILKHKPSLKIIAQTAYAASDESQKAKEHGCVGYISKPIRKDQLLLLLSEFLN